LEARKTLPPVCRASIGCKNSEGSLGERVVSWSGELARLRKGEGRAAGSRLAH
jgi:hypothetical protein